MKKLGIFLVLAFFSALVFASCGGGSGGGGGGPVNEEETWNVQFIGQGKVQGVRACHIESGWCPTVKEDFLLGLPFLDTDTLEESSSSNVLINFALSFYKNGTFYKTYEATDWRHGRWCGSTSVWVSFSSWLGNVSFHPFVELYPPEEGRLRTRFQINVPSTDEIDSPPGLQILEFSRGRDQVSGVSVGEKTYGIPTSPGVIVSAEVGRNEPFGVVGTKSSPSVMGMLTLLHEDRVKARMTAVLTDKGMVVVSCFLDRLLGENVLTYCDVTVE